MPEHAVDVRKGVPVVSRLSWGWAWLFTCVTSGLFMLGMALYISYWLRARRKSGLAFFVYLLFPLALTLSLIPARYFPRGIAGDSLSTVGSISIAALWIGGAFILRRELMLYYASPEGGVLEINPWWTGLFNIYYLNYCLWVVRDSA